MPSSCKALMCMASAAHVIHALQSGRRQTEDPVEEEWTEKPLETVWLDEDEAKSRGAFCLNGAAGAYFFREGTIKNKWILTFQGGGEPCQDEAACANDATRRGFTEPGPARDGNHLQIFKAPEFRDYNHIIFNHCDGGLSLGDRDEPYTFQNSTVHLRGKRIVDHTIDDMIAKKGFGSAEEVLVLGGSGGGQTTVLIADYLGTRMPESVKKYAAAPMNGWMSMKRDPQKPGFDLHNMRNAIVPACREALPEEDHWKCIHTDVAYKYSKTPMFLIQLLDYRQASAGFALVEWHRCMFDEDPKYPCLHKDAEMLNNCINDVVDDIHATDKYKKPGEGGFVSTCPQHVFYIREQFDHFASRGVTTEEAVLKWWKSLGTDADPADNWYWPCKLNDEFPHQCEPSCNWGSDGSNQHAGDGIH